MIDVSFCDRLALTLIHLVWQGTAVAIIVFILNAAFHQSSAHRRYIIHCAGLLALSLCGPLTFFAIAGESRRSMLTEIESAEVSSALDTGADEEAAPAGAASISQPDTSLATKIAEPQPATNVSSMTQESESRLPKYSISERVESATSQTSTPQLSASRAIWIVAMWSIGVLVMLLRLMQGVWRGISLQSVSRTVEESTLLESVAQQARSLKMKSIPAIRYCERIAIPMVVGLVKPVVLVPASLVSGLDAAQLRAVLCHELAHIRRLDPWVNLFQHLIESMLFFHPAVWWISHRVSVEREICCDDLVVSSGCERVTYAGALITAAEIFRRIGQQSRVSEATVLRVSGETQSQFNRRIRRLLGEADDTRLTGFRFLLAAIFLSLVTVACVAAIRQVSDDVPSPAIGDSRTQVPSVPLAWVDNQLSGSPQWGGDSRRNHVSGVSLPLYFDAENGTNVKWTAELGRTTHNTPVVSGGRVFIGTSNAGYIPKYPKNVDLGCLVCFDLETGHLRWQYSVAKRLSPNGLPPYADCPEQGISSAPCVEPPGKRWVKGKYEPNRLWIVNNRAEVVCLDVDGFKNGNNGPVTDEADTGDFDADVLWRFDMIEQLGVTPSYVACTSPTIVGDLLLLNTTHSAILKQKEDGQPAEMLADPNVPGFIAFNRHTGDVVWQDKTASANILDVGWSSPAFDVIDGVPQAVFAGGDGWLYSFDTRDIAKGKSNILWKFDCNPKTSEYKLGGRGDRNTIIATPVIHNGRVYITTGRNPLDGDAAGIAWCVDAAKRGDLSEELVFGRKSATQPIPHRRVQACDQTKGEYTRPNPNSGVVWKFTGDDTDGDGKVSDKESMHRATSCVSVSKGFAVLTDYSGYVHCLDAATGKSYWHHDLLAACGGTPMICRDQVLVGDEDGKVTILKLASEKILLAEIETDNSIMGSLVAGFFNERRLLIPQMNRLLCVEQNSLARSAPTAPKEWHVSTDDGSVYALQSDHQLHFAIYGDGWLTTGMGSGGGEFSWNHEGHVTLSSRSVVGPDASRHLNIKHISGDPQTVWLDGNSFDLKKGRLFAFNTQGTLMQMPWEKRFDGRTHADRKKLLAMVAREVQKNRKKGRKVETTVESPREGKTAKQEIVKKQLAAIDPATTEQTRRMEQTLRDQQRDSHTEYRLALVKISRDHSLAQQKFQEDPANNADPDEAYFAALFDLEKRFRGTGGGFNAIWNVLSRSEIDRQFFKQSTVRLAQRLKAVNLLREHYVTRPELYTCFPYLVHNCPFEESEFLLQEAREKNTFDYVVAASCFHFGEWFQWKATIPVLKQQWQTALKHASIDQKKWISAYLARLNAFGEIKPDRILRSAMSAAEYISGDNGDVRMPVTVPNVDIKIGTGMIFQSGMGDDHRKRRFPTYARRADALLYDLQNLTVGKLAPEISGDDFAGKLMNLSDFRGRITLLIFAANFDRSFQGLNRATRALIETHDPDDFTVVSVRNDRHRGETKAAFKTEDVVWRCWFDGFDGPVSRKWNIRDWPATFLIDRKGVIRDRDVPPDQMADAVEKLLNESDHR